MAVSTLKRRAVTVAAAGTAVRLFAAPYPRISWFQVRATSAHVFYVGDDSVLNSSNRGIKLNGADTVFSLGTEDGTFINTNELYVDCNTNGGTVEVSYMEVV